MSQFVVLKKSGSTQRLTFALAAVRKSSTDLPGLILPLRRPDDAHSLQ